MGEGMEMRGGNKKKGRAGLKFRETMSGFLVRGETDFHEPLSFQVTIRIRDVEAFCKLSGRRAELEGTVSYKPLGQNLPVRKGQFVLFRPEAKTGNRQMTYAFEFTGNDGQDFFFYGYKVIYDDPRKIDILEDMTRLFSRIYKGTSRQGLPVGSGILTYKLSNLPSMLASFKAIDAPSLKAKLKAFSRFFSFCYGEIRDTYLAKHTPLYHTEYENLVVSGKLRTTEGSQPSFFMFSGIHDKDFPWGDEEVFWDLGLLIQKEDGGWSRYALTDRIIENMRLDVDEGTYRYTGPVYELTEGYQVSKSEMGRSFLPQNLRMVQAEIEMDFDCEPYQTLDVPFSLSPHYNTLVPGEALNKIRKWLPHLNTLGWHLTPSRARFTRGKIVLRNGSTCAEYNLLPEQTLGEAEKATFQNIRWPKLYYNYCCALSSATGEIAIKVRSDALRGNRRDAFIDKVEEQLGKIIRHVVRLDLKMTKYGLRILPEKEVKPLEIVDDNLLEINNDHFPTAVFQRRVVAKRDREGNAYHALEEDMDTLNLGSIESDKTVKVVAARNRDKLEALDEVLEKAGFYEKLDEHHELSGKNKDEFLVVVKPNFMFTYSTKDPSTYTDAELVEHLMDRMFERGYRNLACAEARSTYGVFFTNREVKTVARYVGLSERNYRIIDLSEDLEEYRFSGKLGKHTVNRDWKKADFRISFAKNKTHTYARYTLTIKNIYGALPMEDKFYEYHHLRDIYTTTVEFIRHFPIHFALIDAYLSADGPFGIFADKTPRATETIIGSTDLVATDWIGAAKMGLDPMVSDYMKEAVKAFGKPKIQMIGDRSIYPDWVNVTDVLPALAFGVLDKNYCFGNFFYSVFSQMDPFFQYKDEGVGRKLVRVLADPVKSLFFEKVEKGVLDDELNKTLYRMFSSPTS
jgi:uncharacterized protein (DUF362 family)